MARRSLENRGMRSLTKASGGKSYTVTIPVEYVRKLGWTARQQLNVKLRSNGIVIVEHED